MVIEKLKELDEKIWKEFMDLKINGIEATREYHQGIKKMLEG